MGQRRHAAAEPKAPWPSSSGAPAAGVASSSGSAGGSGSTSCPGVPGVIGFPGEPARGVAGGSGIPGLAGGAAAQNRMAQLGEHAQASACLFTQCIHAQQAGPLLFAHLQPEHSHTFETWQAPILRLSGEGAVSLAEFGRMVPDQRGWLHTMRHARAGNSDPLDIAAVAKS